LTTSAHPSAASVEVVREIAPLRAQWSALAERAGNVFVTPEWAETWRAHLAPEADPLVVACRDEDGGLRAIWPVYVAARGPLRVARLLGHGPADELGPACAPEDRAWATEGLRSALGPLRARVLLAERVAADLTPALGGQVLHREGSPVVPVAGRTWEAFLAEQSRNFREQAGRKRRKLEREHEVDWHLTTRPEELPGDLDALLDLHGRRWAEGDSDAFAGALEAFHRAFAAVALERGWLRLWVLRVDGSPVAAWHGFRFGGADAFYQAGRNPEWERWSVGAVLLTHTVRCAFEDGMREYRLLRGEEGYKGRWAVEDRPVDIVAVPAGVLGRPAVAAAAAMTRSPRLRRVAGRALGR
jgi:CelD/BcsL family acetyltransferase involved in cellulose biosynthesis